MRYCVSEEHRQVGLLRLVRKHLADVSLVSPPSKKGIV